MEELTKKYYKIKDVAEMLGVAQSTLRFWEKEFPQCSPKRGRTNIRYYTPQDIETLKIIKFLIKDKGLKIEAARQQLASNPQNVYRRQEMIATLTSVKERLEKMLKALNKRK